MQTQGTAAGFIVPILYGSQTGNAEEIAKQLSEKLANAGVKSRVASLNELKQPSALQQERLALFVVSTTGDGAMPDNADKFWRQLRKIDDAKFFENLSFSLLALGDTNYSKFCQAGKSFDKKLVELGAKRVKDIGLADDGTGLEEVVEPWTDSVVPLVKELVAKLASSTDAAPVSASASSASSASSSSSVELEWLPPASSSAEGLGVSAGDLARARSNQGAFLATVSRMVNLTPSAGDKKVFLMQLLTPDGIATHTPLTPDTTARPLPQTGAAGSPASAPSSSSSSSSVSAPATQAQTQAQTEQPPSGRRSSFSLAPFPVLSTIANFMVTAFRSASPFAALPPPATPSPGPASPNTQSKLREPSPVPQCISLNVPTPNAPKLGSTISPGDVLWVACANSRSLVRDVLDRLQLSGEKDKRFTIKQKDGAPSLPHILCPCSVEAAFTHFIDLSSPPRKTLLGFLATHCQDTQQAQTLRDMATGAAEQAYQQLLLARPSLADLLALFPSCRPPLPALLAALPALTARAYSIASAPRPDGSVDIVFDLVHYDTPAANTQAASKPGAPISRQGVCTGWMYRACRAVNCIEQDTHSEGKQLEDEEVKQAVSALSLSSSLTPASSLVPGTTLLGGRLAMPVWFSTSGFRLPAASHASLPVIMVAAGTGIAPFRGFLELRQQLQAAGQQLGPASLFFGCRGPEDMLFGSELQQHLKDGTLTHLHVAMSRQVPGKKVYVQHLMLEHSGEVFDSIVKQGALVYVCGSTRLGRAVKDTVLSVLNKLEGGPAAAADYLSNMVREGRYLQDVWA